MGKPIPQHGAEFQKFTSIHMAIQISPRISKKSSLWLNYNLENTIESLDFINLAKWHSSLT